MISLCNGWEFTSEWSEDFAAFKTRAESVRLPHNVKELPLHYSSPDDYSMLCGYRRALDIPKELEGKRIFLQLDGAAHIATVYLNGRKLNEHRCGYTAFRTELTESVNFGGENLLSVKLDCTENGEIPPFGYVIDYLTYGGLYREAWLDVREENFVEDVFVHAGADRIAHVEVTTSSTSGSLKAEIRDGKGRIYSEYEGSERSFTMCAPEAELWSCETPEIYYCRVTLTDNGHEDTKEVCFGFRTVEFRADCLYINGKKAFMRGLNRHQCYPYIGYAAAERLQRADADILKHELGCTAVRTSHYPQSHYFIDQCDKLGLLVFTEIPGWQHIGDDKWIDQACENVREMVTQYRNHPSIVLWGVRINESRDNDEFYKRTNAIAHELDPSRPTSGVRYLEKSSLLEDVYAFNDFSHDGVRPGCKKKSEVTPDVSKAFLISEHSGHMFPTKPYDSWEKRQEHALRHARVQNAALDGEHSGCFGWCMFDYATHKDFGSGDRICYHGVMDAFRNPKLAAALYESQSDEHPVLEIGSSLDIGDYPAGNIGEIYAFTNADTVKLYKNGAYVAELGKSPLENLPHGPRPVVDTIGELLETQEGFGKAQADELRELLLCAKAHGGTLPEEKRHSLARCMEKYAMTDADLERLYGKYVGNWGGEATVWRYDAVKDGRVVKSVTRCPSGKLHLDVKTTDTELHENGRYDAVAVRIRILDENGCAAPYAQYPVKLTLDGELELMGPDTVTAEGGMCGTYLRTTGRTGSATLTVSSMGMEPVTIEYTIK